jgi:3-mercaptopyruvate sulfurtransferase SseA
MPIVFRTVCGGIFIISMLTFIAYAAAAEYAHPALLAETDWLAQHLNDSTIRLVDMRSPEAYRKGHIPGAVNLGWQALKGADNGMYVIPPEKFANY